MTTENTSEQQVGATLHEIAKDILTQPEQETLEAKINNGDMLKAHGLHIVHIRPGDSPMGRPMTVAYKVAHRNANSIEIATAILHPRDTFAKKAGTRIAIENFIAGRTVTIPRFSRRYTVVQNILATFGG